MNNNRAGFFKAYPVYRVKYGIFLLLLPLNAVLTDIFKSLPCFTEEIYARKIRPVIMQPLSRLFSLIPISAAEIIIIAAVTGLLFAITRGIILAVKEGRVNKSRIFDCVMRITSVISCVALAFTLTYGGCYYRQSISRSLGIYNFDHTVDDMVNTALILIDEMNEIRSELKISEKDIFTLDISLDELSGLCGQNYQKAAEKNDIFNGDYGRAKGVLLSKPWTYTFVMGMYFPFTGEANINTNIPDSLLPQTLLHEMAHQRGIAKEEDADFAAFYVSREGDSRLKYSADLEALGSILSCLYSSDTGRYNETVAALSEGIIRDINFNSLFWSEYQTKAAEVSSDINNAYLEYNGQEMGIAAYDYSAWLIMDYYANEWEA